MGNDIKGNPTENPITDGACDKVQHMWWDHESFFCNGYTEILCTVILLDNIL